MKLKGYRVSHRNKWLILQNRILTLQELALFEFFIDISDFDPRHDKFGIFEVFLDEVSDVFGKSQDSIRIWHKGLLTKKFIAPYDVKRKFYQLKNPLRYNTKKAEEFHKYENNDKPIQTILEVMTFTSEEFELVQTEKVNLALESDY